MIDKTYYEKMLSKGRLIPFFKDKRLVCFMTFYICNEGEEKRYFRDDMWSVEEDNTEGTVCIIDHLITDKNPENPKLSYEIWHRFKSYIKENYSNVNKIRWNRFKNRKVNAFIKTWEGKNETV